MTEYGLRWKRDTLERFHAAPVVIRDCEGTVEQREEAGTRRRSSAVGGSSPWGTGRAGRAAQAGSSHRGWTTPAQAWERLLGEALGLYSTEKRAGKVRLIATENPRLRHKIRPQWSEIDEGLLAGSTVLARISTDMMNPTWRAHPSAVQAMPAQCRAASWRDPHVSENRRGNGEEAGPRTEGAGWAEFWLIGPKIADSFFFFLFSNSFYSLFNPTSNLNSCFDLQLF
jgi:hypothetical protein